MALPGISATTFLDAEKGLSQDMPTKEDFERLRRVSKSITKEIELLQEVVPKRDKAVANLRTFLLDKESNPVSNLEKILNAPDVAFESTSPGKAPMSHKLANRTRSRPY